MKFLSKLTEMAYCHDAKATSFPFVKPNNTQIDTSPISRSNATSSSSLDKVFYETLSKKLRAFGTKRDLYLLEAKGSFKVILTDSIISMYCVPNSQFF